MRTLSPAAMEQARQSLKTKARPIDRALFEIRFEGVTADAVTGALSAYQNADGGFGRALEPDVRTPASSALATGIALQMLKEIDCPAKHPLVRDAVSYLMHTFDADDHVWRVVPPETNDYPHAPWWHDEEGSLRHTFDGFLVIPRAQIVGLLHHFAANVPEQWLEKVTERTISGVETIEALGTGGGDDLAYALSLAEEEAVPERYRERLLRRLRAVVPRAVSQDPTEWDTYCIHPLKVVHKPASPVAHLLEESVQADLDYQIERQTPQGTWDPVWTWGGAYPQAWEQARQEWRGHLTLETLTILQAFGRIEQ
ncbi:MAG: hypothetical protein ACP5JJ_13190 [Anaerolineae bacterium]